MSEGQQYKGARLTVRSVAPPGATAVDATAEAESLYIDDHQIPTTRSEGSGQYWTYLLPYQEFATLQEMGEAIVDNVHGKAALEATEHNEP